MSKPWSKPRRQQHLNTVYISTSSNQRSFHFRNAVFARALQLGAASWARDPNRRYQHGTKVRAICRISLFPDMVNRNVWLTYCCSGRGRPALKVDTQFPICRRATQRRARIHTGRSEQTVSPEGSTFNYVLRYIEVVVSVYQARILIDD